MTKKRSRKATLQTPLSISSKPAGDVPQPSQRQWAIVLLALVVLTSAVYIQVARFEFIDLDDTLYVTQNDHVRQGLMGKRDGPSPR
jgi:hypothetical protein